MGDNGKRYLLRLYVAGETPRSVRAVTNLKKLCEENFPGRYELEVVDLFKAAGTGEDDRIVAVPTLIKRLPPPLRRFIGDLSDREHILVGLELKEKE